MDRDDKSRGPLVSILICTYNRAEYLDESLYSVLRQDFRDYELVIRDNHSTDDTRAVVDKYEPLFDLGENYRYIRNETNVGFQKNMRDGITRDCRGKYCVNLADDDFFISDKILSSYVAILEASSRTAFVTCRCRKYLQGEEAETPKEIIDQSVGRDAGSNNSRIDGNLYFLNFWSKYQGIAFSATMFRRELAIERKWVEYGCLDQSLALLLALNNEVVFFYDQLACYRTHNAPSRGAAPLRFSGLRAEHCIESHKAIDKWVAYARKSTNMSRFSLLAWRLKTVILKDRSTIRWLHRQDEAELARFFTLVKRHSFPHYLVLRYLCHEMMLYDTWSRPRNLVLRKLRSAGLRLRAKIAEAILKLDRVLHDPEHQVGVGGKALRWVLGDGKMISMSRRARTKKSLES